MSIDAMGAVWQDRRAEGTDRLVLLVLADYANEERRAFPSVATIAIRCRVSTRTVQRSLKRLCESGCLLLEIDRSRQQRPNVYRVLPPDNLSPSPPDTSVTRSVSPSTTASEGSSGNKGSGDNHVGGSGRQAKPIPEELTPAQRSDLDAVVQTLSGLCEAKGATPPDPGTVADAMVKYADRDHVEEAVALALWMTEGNGINVPLRSVHGRWRDWLRTAAPAGSQRQARRSSRSARVAATIDAAEAIAARGRRP